MRAPMRACVCGCVCVLTHIRAHLHAERGLLPLTTISVDERRLSRVALRRFATAFSRRICCFVYDDGNGVLFYGAPQTKFSDVWFRADFERAYVRVY